MEMKNSQIYKVREFFAMRRESSAVLQSASTLLEELDSQKESLVRLMALRAPA